jgi:hypothetical protein
MTKGGHAANPVFIGLSANPQIAWCSNLLIANPQIFHHWTARIRHFFLKVRSFVGNFKAKPAKS